MPGLQEQQAPPAVPQPAQRKSEMPGLSNAINRVSISPTSAVLIEAEKMRARGIDLVDFGPGEPDFPTPDHIKRAAIKALEENRTKYTATAGILPLRLRKKRSEKKSSRKM